MKRERVFFLISAAAGVLILLGYQNCGRMPLKMKEESSPSVVMRAQSLGSFCAPPGIEVQYPQKFIFIHDMSASNLGNYTTVDRSTSTTAQFYVSCPPQTLEQAIDMVEQYSRCCVSPTDCSPCPRPTTIPCDPGTDPFGVRFDAVNSFILNCPQAQAENSTFALIGFSDRTVLPYGYPGRSCTDLLTSKTVALDENLKLKKVQTDILPYTPHPFPPGHTYAAKYSMSEAFPMRTTSYRSALQCYHDKVFEDLNPNEPITDYKVFFITDGRSTDSAQAQSQYNTILTNLNSLFSQYRYRARFTPIYYGPDSEYADAKARLDAISQKANELSEFQETIRLDPSSGTFENQLSEALCNSPAPTTTVAFQEHAYFAINLSNHQFGTRLVADSDSDGVPDSAEADLDFDPQKAHSRKLLDGLCLLNKPDCDEFEDQTDNCDPTVAVGYGFNDCDRKFANQLIGQESAFKPFTGVDWDRDDMIDLVEILKGTNPFVADLAENPDNDDKNTRAELIRGTDPRSTTTQTIVDRYGSDFEFVAGSDSCETEGSFSVSGKKFPVAETLSNPGESFYQVNFPPEEPLHMHDAGENLVLLLYLAKPIAHQTSAVHYYGRLVKVRGNQLFSFSEAFEIGALQ